MGKTNAELQSDLDKANARIKELENAPATSGERLAQLENELTKEREARAAAESQLAGKDKELADAQEIIAEQHKALSISEQYSDHVIITVDKVKYKVVAPAFNLGGKNYTAADLKDNKELAAKLVEKNSSVLEKLS